MVELENYTKFYLSPQDTEINTVYIAVFGGEKHVVVGHNVGSHCQRLRRDCKMEH